MKQSSSFRVLFAGLTFAVLCLFSPGASNEVDVLLGECDCDPLGTASCGENGVCVCKRGVGGSSCDQCLPGWANLTENGCSLERCNCHSNGSISQECNEDGECLCHAGAMGSTCDVCRFGFRRIDLGCVSCPDCFDEVAVLFDKTQLLYNELLLQLNATLSGDNDGQPSRELLEQLQQYRILLNSLFERAINATTRENVLRTLLTEIIEETNALRNLSRQFGDNVTLAELATEDLSLQIGTIQNQSLELEALVETLTVQVSEILPEQLSDIQRLYQELTIEFDRLVELATHANNVSLDQEDQANSLLLQANNALANSVRALQTLNEAIVIQNETLVSLQMLESETLPPLLELLSQGRTALMNAERDVPHALAQARQVLEAALNLSLPTFELESRRSQLEGLKNQTQQLRDSVIDADSNIEALISNFTSLNTTVTELLVESQELNERANNLLLQAHGALAFANSSVEEGNLFISEVQQLLEELQRRLTEGIDFTAGLEEVIRNVELAETQSNLAESEAEQSAAGVRRAAQDVSIATQLLEEASQTLQEALRIATIVNGTAAEILANATSLNASTTELVNNVAEAESEVDTLQDAVTEDQQAIARVTDTATETISLATNLSERILVIRDQLTNLSLELNATTLLPPQQLREANDTLTSLEQEAASNQELIETLVEQVNELQTSAAQLRDRYTQLTQHRDLLQTILGNVKDLDCLSQFATN